MSRRPTADDFLRIGPNVRVLPIIHGSGDFAIRVREELLDAAVRLPGRAAAAVVPGGRRGGRSSDCRRSRSSCSSTPTPTTPSTGFSYVPIDPCQGVIAALRSAIGERIAREFIDMETPRFEAQTGDLPRPLRPEAGQPRGLRRGRPAGDPAAGARPARRPDRLDGRAAPRAGVALSTRSCSSARCSTGPGSATPTTAGSSPTTPSRSSRRSRRSPSIPKTLIFVLGELPFLTGLYERGRRELTPDDNLSVDGVKEMVLARPRPPEGEAPEGRRSGSRRSCSRSTSATSATSR